MGTRGLGGGTTAEATYDGFIPEGKHPVTVVTLPARPGDTPARLRVELNERC